jgi:hypothetical protein
MAPANFLYASTTAMALAFDPTTSSIAFFAATNPSTLTGQLIALVNTSVPKSHCMTTA